MKRGQLYRVHRGGADPPSFRTCVVVSRAPLISSRFSTVICAPVYTNGEGLSTQVQVGIEEGLKNTNWICCDNLVSIEKTFLTQYLGFLSPSKLAELNRALALALGLT